MLFGVLPYAFIMPGYATIALTKREQQRLTERFMKKDFGVATLTEKVNNAGAFKRGGEIVGRYLFKGHEWVVWCKVAAPSAKPDLSPGYLLHAKEYRDNWHLGPKRMTVGDDYPTERLHDEDQGHDITITTADDPVGLMRGTL